MRASAARDSLSLGALLLIALLLGLGIPWILPHTARQLPSILSSSWLLCASAIYRHVRPGPTCTGASHPQAWIAYAVVFAATALLVLLSLVWPAGAASALAPSTLTAGLVLVLIAPVGEELFFRGAALDHFCRLWGQRVSIAIVSVVFGLLHLPQGALGRMLALSLVLCALRLLSGSLVWAVLGHCAWNGLAWITTVAPGPGRITIGCVGASALVATGILSLRTRPRLSDQQGSPQ